MDAPQLAQAAALLTEVLRHDLPTPCSVEEIEQQAHRRAHQLARAALEQRAQEVVDAAEATPPAACACGGQPHHRLDRVAADAAQCLLRLGGTARHDVCFAGSFVFCHRFACPSCVSIPSHQTGGRIRETITCQSETDRPQHYT